MLPKLNSTPKYEVMIPSMKKVVKFRPYLVKEEKTLLLAIESQDIQQTMSAMVDVIEACVEDDIDTSKLTTFDVEYLMVKIRSKSVGENAYLNLKCDKCGHLNENVLNLDNIEMTVPNVKNKIELTDKVSLKMRWPSFSDISSNPEILKTESEVEQSFMVVAKCIESIQTEEENILAKDVDTKELIDFIESFTSSQYAKIRDFIESMPRLEHKVEFDCESCGEHNELELSGMNDFF